MTLSATIINGPNGTKYIMCAKDGAILVKDNQVDAVRDIEDSYNRNHGRGYEASMSACVHSIMFQPTIVQIPNDVSTLIEMFDGLSVYRINNVSGSYYGRRLKQEVAEVLLKTEIRPRLIS